MSNSKIGFLMFNEEKGTCALITGIPEEDGERCCAFLREHIADAGAHGKEVWIIRIDEAAYLKSGKSKSGEIPELDKSFRSAQAASDFLGYTRTNPVAQKLGDARRAMLKENEEESPGNTFSIHPETTIHGLTFQYEVDVKDL
jgi:hypothetical protein